MAYFSKGRLFLIYCGMQVTAEAAQRMLKDLMFRQWADEGCQSTSDVVKLLSLIDFYLPFLPLEKIHLQELFETKLRQRRQSLLQASQEDLIWDKEVVEFLVSKVCIHWPRVTHLEAERSLALSFQLLLAQVDFEGEHPIEGAKEVKTLMTRYVTRAMRGWAAKMEADSAKGVAMPKDANRTFKLEIAEGAKALLLASLAS